MVFEEETTLFVDIRTDDGLHLYGRPIPDGYIATEVAVEGPDDVEVGEVRYPATTPFRVHGLPEEFHVFDDSRISMEVPIRNQSRELDPFSLRINVRYQACSDSACFLPQKQVLELDVPRLPLNRPASSD
jgi:DsbC/DsbD-like thiol-disulfide interchange protein